jgi:chloride channel protein, CIC family
LTTPNPIYSRLSRLEPGRVLLHSALAGLLVGLGGVLFTKALEFTTSIFANLGTVSPELPSRGGVLFAFDGPLKLAPLVLFPLLFLVLALTRQTHPRKTALEGFIEGHHAPVLPLERTRGSLWRLLGGTLTLGAGVPLGRDGPLAGLGSWLGGISARLGRLEPGEARLVRLSGVAAGLGLALHAPLAAAVFAVEVLYRRFEFELEALLPAVLSSIFAYGVYGTFLGFGGLFTLELPVALPLLALPLCLLLGVLCAALGSLFSGALEYLRKGWTALEGRPGKIKLQVWAAPLIGLLLAGLMIIVPQVQGEGLGWLQLGANGLLSPAELWGLGLFRLLALLLLAGIGIPGGVLLPTLVLGGTLGAVLGGLQNLWLPDLGLGMGAWTVLGACTLLSALCKTPLSSVLLGLAWGGESLLPGLLLSPLERSGIVFGTGGQSGQQ